LTNNRVVESTWRGGLCCDVKAGDFTITVDEPERFGGTNLGPEPTAVLLASVASCFTIALSYCARNQSVALDDLSVRVTGTYDGQRFRAITIECHLGCDPAQIEPLVNAAERVCYVTNTLKSEIEIHLETTAMTSQAS